MAMIASIIAVVIVGITRLATKRLDTVKGVVNQDIPMRCAINVSYTGINYM